MADKEAIGPIYAELQGYLAQAPKASRTNEETVWLDVNGLLQELNKLTGKNYTKFHLYPITSEHDEPHLYLSTYRRKLGGLIARLHREYFLDESTPFASMPSMVIQQNQHQNQSVEIQFLLEVNNLINEKLNKAPEGTTEKKFLEKIRGPLSKVKNVSQFVTLVIMTAKEMGISLEQLASLFS